MHRPYLVFTSAPVGELFKVQYLICNKGDQCDDDESQQDNQAGCQYFFAAPRVDHIIEGRLSSNSQDRSAFPGEEKAAKQTA